MKNGEFDLWAGFGEPEETNENDEVGEKKNDIRVVLLNEEQKKATPFLIVKMTEIKNSGM